MFTHKIIIAADPEVIAVAKAVVAAVNRWLDRDDAAEVARFLYDRMADQKANVDDNFLMRRS